MATKLPPTDGERRRNGADPYFERLSPAFEYDYTRAGESPRFEVRIFDDREDVGQRTPAIQVQFTRLGRYRKVATFEATDLDELDELIADLSEARKALS